MKTRSSAYIFTTLAVATGLLLAGCQQDPQDSPEPESSGPVEVATGLEAPWSIVFVPQEDQDPVPLVSERNSAKILQLAEDGSTADVATIAGVRTGGEGGLLGLAVDPADSESLYVYSTGQDGNRVQRYPLEAESKQLSLGEPVTVIEQIPAAGIHNGGRIDFGPDGKLYVATGDASNGSLAQDEDSLAGKILRLNPDGSVPADNPNPDSPVYSLGHRNVQGLAWDEDGRLFASEFGASDWDELNLIEPGKNYGWPQVEGMPADEDADSTAPLQVWKPAEASPSGVAIVDGNIYIANLRGQSVRTVPLAELTESEVVLSDYGRIRDVVVSPDNKLWVLTNNTDGRGEPAEGDDRIIELDPPVSGD
ncbi:PQQ-dependent sugar dehydrogenase [Micrococcoides hystricis]|uniref:PQQ-dependent sugar dehydrogenase n=1 Tax=Micrococcoides hystricis TaxID=1572761 RepID=A0ABV6P9B8_9MICC